MERSSKALRLLTVEVDALIEMIGEAAADNATAYVQALSARGYVPVPIPWGDGPIARGGSTDLLILTKDEKPIPPPRETLLRAIAFLENAFHVGRSIGEPGESQKERIVDIADGLEKLSPDERSILGAHYHYVLNTPQDKPRPIGLISRDAVSRDRIIRSLYAAVTADGTLYDVVVERFEAVLKMEGLEGSRIVASMIPARQVILRYARTEHDPSRWTGLEESEAKLLSWIVARPKAVAEDLEHRARQLGLEPYEALLRIKGWIDSDPSLVSRSQEALPAPVSQDDQRP